MIKILLFAGISEKVGKPELVLEEDQLTVAQLLERLIREYPALREDFEGSMIALNEEFAESDTMITAEDTVAIIPPVSGG